MKLLVLDTSAEILSAGLYDGPKQKAFYESDSFRRHSESLMPAIDKMLKKVRWSITDLDVIAVGLGPGSFSGLRIGVMAAKIFSYSSKAKLIGVSSLTAIARSAKEEGEIAVVRDAKKEQVYAALYEKKNGKLQEKIAPGLFDAEVFMQKCKASTVVLKDTPSSAAGIASLALEKIEQKKFEDPFKLEPKYIHPKDCNVTLKK